MAMIKCPECGREISDKAVKCVYCGCLNEVWNNEVQNKKNAVESTGDENSVVREDSKALMVTENIVDTGDVELGNENFNTRFQKKNKTKMGIICGLVAMVVVVFIGISTSTSSEARKVIQEINSLGNITVDSYSAIKQAQDDYLNLNDTDRAAVKNIDVLDRAIDTYNDARITALNNDISKACSSANKITANSYLTLKKLQERYLALDSIEKSKISDGEKLSEILQQAKKLYAEEQISNIIELSKNDLGSAEEQLKTYSDVLDESEIKRCISQMAEKYVKDSAERCLKEHLKSPSSYKRSSIYWVAPVETNGTYSTVVAINYSAANSFGVQLSGTATIGVDFTVNVDECSFDITATSLYGAN